MKMILALMIIGNLYGCSAALPVIQTVGSGAAATGAYFSYKASKQPTVEVTTLARECVWYKYVRVSCPSRVALTPDEARAIRDNNRLYEELCPDAVVPDKLECQ